MSQNLMEFLKVLTIVITFSGCIIAGRHYMLSLDDADEEPEDSINIVEEKEAI